MTRSILYQPPTGARIRNASLDVILSDIRDRDKSYWNQENYHAGIHLGTNLTFDPSLTILFHEGYGFYIEARGVRDSVGDAYIASMSDDYDDVVKVWAGQNFLRLPRAFFLSREMALQAVESFCRTGERGPAVKWIPMKGLNWVFYDPDADDDEDDS